MMSGIQSRRADATVRLGSPDQLMKTFTNDLLYLTEASAPCKVIEVEPRSSCSWPASRGPGQRTTASIASALLPAKPEVADQVEGAVERLHGEADRHLYGFPQQRGGGVDG